MDPNRQWIVLARILRPQGRKGEVLAELLTDFPSRFARRPHAHVAPTGFAEGEMAPSESAPRPVQITSHWLPTGRNSGRVVLHFAGVDSIAQAEAFAGKEVIVPLSERISLEDGAVYVSDLVGSAVYDHDRLLGTIEDVQFPATPDGSRRLDEAAPLLVVRGAHGEELLVPFAKNYLVATDTAAKTIRMELPEGLAELNRSAETSE